MAIQWTPSLNLGKPDFGEPGSSWWSVINANFDKIDAGIITANKTITVAPSGGNYTTLAAAVASLNNQWISAGATVTIEIDDGQWSHSGGVSVLHPSNNIVITGKNRHTKTMSSVFATAGSAGNYLINIVLNNVANIAANDYIIVTSATGGTNPQHMCGVHKVTAVDSENSRIEVNSKNLVGVPAGAVSATVQVIKTIITVNAGHFVRSYCNRLQMSNIVIVGGTGQWSGFLNYEGFLDLSHCGASGFSQTMYSKYSKASTVATNCAFSAGNVTILDNSTLEIKSSAVTGSAVGISAQNGAFVNATSSVVFAGNTTDTSPAGNTIGNHNAYIRTS